MKPKWIFNFLMCAALGICLAARADDTELVGPSARPLDPEQPAEKAANAAPVVSTGEPGADLPVGGSNEPTIAVDPNNPLNIAEASLRQIRVSTNAGATYFPAVQFPLPATHCNCGDSSVAYDSQGRLFWTFLGCLVTNGVCSNAFIDVFIARVNPTNGNVLAGYPVNVTASPGVNLSAVNGNQHDKEWLAADFYTGSPFQDRLYIVWTDLTGASIVRTTFSTDQGQTWSASVQLSGAGEGFVWPSHNTVAPNGDVYASYHSQAGPLPPPGTTGQVFVVRSTNGGGAYPQKNRAYLPGQADITFNVAGGGGTIPGTRFWLQGSAQPWVLADPNTAGRIYVVACDDSDNNHGSGDDADVYIVISTNNGVSWLPPTRIDNGTGTTFQVMPTAGIDPVSGCIAVHYYDNRNNNMNGAGRFLLDVFATRSSNGGVTFGPDFQINDVAFDPDPGAPFRFPGTTRIGEYNGVALGGDAASAVWCGNTVDGLGNANGQQTIFDVFACLPCTLTCPADITTPNDLDQCGAVVNFTTGAVVGCGPVSSSPPSGSFFPVGTTSVTSTSATGSSCTFAVTVNDTQPPDVTCSSDIVTNTDPGLCTANVTFTTVVSDNCPGAGVVCTPPSGTDFPIGTTVVSCTATDAAGNSTVCNFEVTVSTCSTNPPVVVTQNVTVDFNTSPPSYIGDPALQPFVTADTSGPTPDTWKMIINTDRRKLVISSGVTITTVPVPAKGNNRRAPGIEIHTCELEVQTGATILVDSVNKQAGDIVLNVLGDTVINGTVYNSVTGTQGRPGAIRIGSLCQNITSGPASRIITYGQDDGGSDITVATCDSGDITINGLVDASYKAKLASTIRISAFDGSVHIDGTNPFGTEVVAGTLRTVTSGVSVRSRRDPLPGAILIQALDDINVQGNTLLSKKYPNYGAVAVKTASNSSKGGLIDARAINGSIIAIDRAFDDANRFNQTAVINLAAGIDIALSVSGSVNDGAGDNTKAVVSTQAGDTGKGGTNMLQAFNNIISIGLRAQVLANFTGRPGADGANRFTVCNGVSNLGTVAPAALINAGCGGAPDPLFMDCADIGFTFEQP